MNSLRESSQWRGFIESIRVNPGDYTTRLVAADFLQEQDRPEWTAWAEFIRHQVAIASAPMRLHVYSDSCDCDVCGPERRSVRLKDQWGLFWNAIQVPGFCENSQYHTFHYRLGFLDQIEVRFRPWNMKDTSFQVRDLFRYSPLELAGVSLAESSFQNSYIMIAKVETNKEYHLASVRMWSPFSPNLHKVVSQSRIVSHDGDLGRAISGAVAMTLQLRGELSEP